MAPSPDDQAALIAAARSQRDALVGQAAAGISAAWELYGPGGENNWEAFYQTVSWLAPDMMASAASITAAFMDAWSTDGTVSPVINTTNGLRKVGLAQEYYRPWSDYQKLVKTGSSQADALAEAKLRLDRLIRTDMQLAQTRQANESCEAHGYAGFQRVPKGGTSCALCLLAASQLYHTGTLMPIHVGCDCGVAPVGKGAKPQWYGSADAIRSAIYELDDDEFDAALDDSGELNYRAVRLACDRVVEIREHGDIGPVLTKRGDHFTGPADIQAAIEAAR